MQSQQKFWMPAVPYIQIWRCILGCILAHAGFFAANVFILFVVSVFVGRDPISIALANTPIDAALFFMSFLGYHLGLLLVVRLLHKRSYRSLLGPSFRLNLRQMGLGFVAGVVILVCSGVLQDLLSRVLGLEATLQDVEQLRPLGDWAIMVLPAIILIFIQISAEELVFRGYMLQQLRARFTSIWLWAILPSVGFGMLHFSPALHGVNAYFYVIYTTVVGVLLAIVTLRTGNIGAAIGLHFSNNLGMILIGNSGNLEGFSLYVSEVNSKSTEFSVTMVAQILVTISIFLIWFVAFRAKPVIANANEDD